MQLNKAKKVERAQALQLHEELVIDDEHIQDLNHEVVVVSYIFNLFFKINIGI